MDFVKIIADWLMLPLVALAAWALIFRVENARRYEIYVRIILSGVTSYALARIAATFYQPAEMRPFELLGIEPGATYLDNPGFPSDHALFAMFLTMAVFCATKNWRFGLAMLILTLAICVGRVLALVHTPLDVAGGLVFAIFGAIWYVKLFKIKLSSSKKRKNVVK